MQTTFYRVLRGKVNVEKSEPDGDTVRFRPERPELLQVLERGNLLRPNQKGEILLRLDNIDAPEVHFQGGSQPLGDLARERLLRRLGFRSVRFSLSNPLRVGSTVPEEVPIVVLTRGADVYGRLISYIIPKDPEGLPKDGQEMELSERVLRRTVNCKLLLEGAVYYTVYASSPLWHRQFLAEIASVARRKERGVWKVDKSGSFSLEDVRSVGPEGALILPKLFRRVFPFLKARAEGFKSNLRGWFLSPSGALARNDRVEVGGRPPLPLSELLVSRHDRVSLQADLLSLVFLPR